MAGHHGNLEFARPILRDGTADQPAPVGGHEIDHRHVATLRRPDEVALVLAVLVVADDAHAAFAQGLQGNARPDRSSVMSFFALHELLDVLRQHVDLDVHATPRTPLRDRGRRGGVCGMMLMVIRVAETEPSVSEMPSSAIEPRSMQ